MNNLFEKIAAHYQQELPFVAYRKPNSDTVKAILQKDASKHIISDYSESGFVFAPFDNEKESILIPLENVIEETYVPSLINTVEDDSIQNSETDKEFHIKLVEQGIEAILNGEFEKVVLSRKEALAIGVNKPIDLFVKLLNTYTNAFVYLWYHPKVGCWLGATPEVLLKVHGNRFKTMALAGTQVYSDTIEWGEKEQEEQRLVTQFIEECLSSENITFKSNKPYTARAGNLAHIRTDIEGTIDTDIRLTKLLQLLHPTPAVCGLPKASSKQFILEKEGYDRAFYTGFLGELNMAYERRSNRRNTENHAYRLTTLTSELYVNLRCMQVNERTIAIYVGGGITADSIPKLEYQETCNKAKTMGSVIGL